MKCENCKNGKYDKHTGTVACRVLNRTLLSNKANICSNYEDSANVRRAKERGTYKECD